MDVRGAAATLAAFRALSRGPLNINLFCHRPALRDAGIESAWIERLRPEFEALGNAPPDALHEIYRSYDDDAEMHAWLLRARPEAVSFHFGPPERGRIGDLRGAGIVLIASATSLAEGRAAAAAGVDAVVAQGWEAGGYRGIFDPDAPDAQTGTLALTRLLVRDLDIP